MSRPILHWDLWFTHSIVLHTCKHKFQNFVLIYNATMLCTTTASHEAAFSILSNAYIGYRGFLNPGLVPPLNCPTATYTT